MVSTKARVNIGKQEAVDLGVHRQVCGSRSRKNRSRLCDKGYNLKKRSNDQRFLLASQLFSAVSHLLKLVSIMMSVGWSNNGKPSKLGHHDTRREHVQGTAQRLTCVRLPADEMRDEMSHYPPVAWRVFARVRPAKKTTISDGCVHALTWFNTSELDSAECGRSIGKGRQRGPYLRSVCMDLEIQVKVEFRSGSSTANSLTVWLEAGPRSKHIDTKCVWVPERAQDGDLSIKEASKAKKCRC